MAKLQKYIRRYTSISAVIDILRRRELVLLDPRSWDDRNDSYFLDLYREKRDAGGVYAICAATCSETYHHWKVFTGTADGACLEIKREPLEETLAEIDGIRFGEVEYLRVSQVENLTGRNLKELPFLKREGFAAEEEYRVIAETDEAQRSSVGVPFPLSWINHIYLNPWLPKSVAESVTATLKDIKGCKNLKVSSSKLINSSRWKRAGDEIAGRKPRTRRLQLTKSRKR